MKNEVNAGGSYELINKQTGATYPVEALSIGDTVTCTVVIEGTRQTLGFRNTLRDGNLAEDDGTLNLEDDLWTIRQVGTQLTPNNDGIVSDEGKEYPIAPETASDISMGRVSADEVEAKVEAEEAAAEAKTEEADAVEPEKPADVA